MDLAFEIDHWIGSAIADPLERTTLAALRITAGPNRIPITEVEDTLARSVRPHIHVAVYPLANWLLVNWWRLRWEPEPRAVSQPSFDWLRAHSMAAIGGDYVWPAAQFSSDGELIQLRLQAETATDVSAIRYLQDVTVDIPAAHFERAVDRFLDQVEARIGSCLPGEYELSELRNELREERADPVQAQRCKLQALAGIDPGAASGEWFDAVNELVSRAGPVAGEEIVATIPALKGGISAAAHAISAMRSSTTHVSLEWAECLSATAAATEVPWQRGARLAAELRRQLGLAPGPIPRTTMEDLLKAKLPLPRSSWNGESGLRGGFRNGVTGGRTALLVTSPREDNQRFYLARMIGAALLASPEQHVLPVSDMNTALQKFERSFAQELLCPWSALDAFTDERGLDDDALADAAERFVVSEQVIRSTLVNKKKLARDRLEA